MHKAVYKRLSYSSRIIITASTTAIRLTLKACFLCFLASSLSPFFSIIYKVVFSLASSLTVFIKLSLIITLVSRVATKLSLAVRALTWALTVLSHTGNACQAWISFQSLYFGTGYVCRLSDCAHDAVKLAISIMPNRFILFTLISCLPNLCLHL